RDALSDERQGVQRSVQPRSERPGERQLVSVLGRRESEQAELRDAVRELLHYLVWNGGDELPKRRSAGRDTLMRGKRMRSLAILSRYFRGQSGPGVPGPDVARSTAQHDARQSFSSRQFLLQYLLHLFQQ